MATGTSELGARPLPNDSASIGLARTTRAAGREPGGLQPCNAYDLVVGRR